MNRATREWHWENTKIHRSVHIYCSYEWVQICNEGSVLFAAEQTVRLSEEIVNLTHRALDDAKRHFWVQKELWINEWRADNVVDAKLIIAVTEMKEELEGKQQVVFVFLSTLDSNMLSAFDFKQQCISASKQFSEIN